MIKEKLSTLFLPYPGRLDRMVRVFVPEHEEGERLPVIYMTDGQNLFDEESSSFGCWHIREALREERKVSGRTAIVVGIHNMNPWRRNELLPASIGEIHCPEQARPFVNPQGELFDAFVLKTVMPAVEERFPVKTGRENTAFCGSSMGGLQSFFTVLSHPEVFGAAGVLSPAFLFYSEEDMRRWIQTVLRKEKPFLYLYSGAGEELEQLICRSMESTIRPLEECCPKDRMKIVFQADRIHHELAWEPVFRDLLHLFVTERLQEQSSTAQRT